MPNIVSHVYRGFDTSWPGPFRAGRRRQGGMPRWPDSGLSIIWRPGTRGCFSPSHQEPHPSKLRCPGAVSATLGEWTVKRQLPLLSDCVPRARLTGDFWVPKSSSAARALSALARPRLGPSWWLFPRGLVLQPQHRVLQQGFGVDGPLQASAGSQLTHTNVCEPASLP